jgi:hypothetical protein
MSTASQRFGWDLAVPPSPTCSVGLTRWVTR